MTDYTEEYMGKYIMKDGKAIRCPDLLAWGKWFETAERSIGRDITAKGVRVSTVFLGIDHGFPCCYNSEEEEWNYKENWKPVLWETMIFGGPLNEEQWRYNSLEKAKRGHQCALRLALLTDNWWYAFWHCRMKPFWYEHIQPYVEMI